MKPKNPFIFPFEQDFEQIENEEDENEEDPGQELKENDENDGENDEEDCDEEDLILAKMNNQCDKDGDYHCDKDHCDKDCDKDGEKKVAEKDEVAEKNRRRLAKFDAWDAASEESSRRRLDLRLSRDVLSRANAVF
jgi:hypothetical protein